MSHSKLPAYERALSRRSMIKGTLGTGLVVAVPGLACGSDDTDVFQTADTVAAPAATTAPIATTAPVLAGADAATPEALATEAPATEAPAAEDAAAAQPAATEAPAAEAPVAETAVEDSGTAVSPSAAATALATGALMEIAFTYERASGGKPLPPYVAVWLEDADGTLLETVALWYQQDRKGTKWLPDLKRWYTRDQDRIAAGGADTSAQISSATRMPGAYTLAWDGSVAGTPAEAGSYFLCIESSREHGPYSLIRESLDLNGAPVNRTLTPDGELVAASVLVA